MNKETDEKTESVLIQLDSFLNSIEVKGASVEFLFKTRLLLKDLNDFIKDNYFEKETEEDKLNKEV